ncbi:MAG TPA: hypothetical protein VG711_08125, partial [Phycisphaerales bacterium]|nr:hypothetical protein [Phycisphaerales bacterium]
MVVDSKAALMRAVLKLLPAVFCLWISASAPGQTSAPPAPPSVSSDLLDRPISAVTLESLKRVDKQKVLNNIRAAVGDPYDPDVVKQDVATLERLGEFKYVDAKASLA